MRPVNHLSFALIARSIVSPVVDTNKITVDASPAKNANSPLEHFLSYSIEFSSFADFAGNRSNPNTYSYNLILLSNIAKYAGSQPLVRVGGNTQDLTLFNASQKSAVQQYFQCPESRLSGKSDDRTGILRVVSDALLDSVPYACRALRDRFYGWELGNEPDFYALPISGPNPPRGSGRNEEQYAAEWLEWPRKIRSQVQKACPDLAKDSVYKYLAPSLAGSPALINFSAAKIFSAGLDSDNTVGILSQHKYIAARGQPGITLQGTLINHTSNKRAVNELLAVSASIQNIPNKNFSPSQPQSRTFQTRMESVAGICIKAPTTAIKPGSPSKPGTQLGGPKPHGPCYGNIATSAFLGDLTKSRPQVVDLGLQRFDESAYASYVNGKLAKIAVINLREYNASADNASKTSAGRPSKSYTFQLPRGCRGASVQRLSANGSDAITGVTFDGFSYAAELNEGRPVRLNNVTRGESVAVRKGELTIQVPNSGAVILSLQ
ncbi:Putative glycosyl hydrolase, all-beta, glycoside hydrolase superfamily, beta-glucuronidase [Septoria linicola]|uniref:Glycosyl hydrolase, all-beta, glycoside hydrolase superfamily, beta-glucuronidase n=1 Tax=Septoria linicola TaxID=215465 RepID=A0A9Q9B5W1_9PEZI|nr:Putative glycosyl hydrolase, all-beta, glycoside hydrolase superfamily, beta-glucuronidase [Septoria linicola]